MTRVLEHSRILPKGTYCNIFRLHLERGWTNDPNKKSTGSDTGEANISRFSASRLQKYLDALYLPIAQKTINHGLYVVIVLQAYVLRI